MGLFELLFGRAPKPNEQLRQTFKMLNGYSPVFTSYSGGVYESELIRAAINAKSTHISKLQIDITGSARPSLARMLKLGPNSLQSWSQFMSRLSTILEVHNTAFITPVFGEYGEVNGIYTPLPDRCEIVAYNGVPWLRYKFGDGKAAAVEFNSCGVMLKHQYRSDFLGENNRALVPTMDLIHMQEQGIKEGVKSAATYRFMAQMNNFSKTEELAKERKRFTAENLASDSGGGGLLLFPNTYANIKQIDAKPWVIDAEQMKLIRENVFDYFGVNSDVLENKAYGDLWSAFYEGAIEPFAIQFSEVLTKMLYTPRERAQGNRVMATANRLQYLSNTEKLNVSSQMLDRGIMSINDVREIWNLPPVDGGDARIIRGEYYNAEDKVNEQNDSGVRNDEG